MLFPTWHFERRSDRAEHWSRDLNLVTSSAHAAEVEPGWWRGEFEIRELEVKEICLSTLRLPNTRSDTKWQKNMMNRWLSSTLIAGKSWVNHITTQAQAQSHLEIFIVPFSIKFVWNLNAFYQPTISKSQIPKRSMTYPQHMRLMTSPPSQTFLQRALIILLQPLTHIPI